MDVGRPVLISDMTVCVCGSGQLRELDPCSLFYFSFCAAALIQTWKHLSSLHLNASKLVNFVEITPLSKRVNPIKPAVTY